MESPHVYFNRYKNCLLHTVKLNGNIYSLSFCFDLRKFDSV